MPLTLYMLNPPLVFVGASLAAEEVFLAIDDPLVNCENAFKRGNLHLTLLTYSTSYEFAHFLLLFLSK